ncbi:MAG: YggT family protein [Actinomycetes bacterium]
MSGLGTAIIFALQIFLVSLFARVILDYIRIFSPSWRPRGIVLAIAEAVYAITDPIMRVVRRFIPPLRIGPVSVDISFILIFFVTEILISFARRIH